MKTKIGRVPMIVDTMDTGPLSIAQKDSTTPTSARVSLKMSKEIAKPWCCIQCNSLKTPGLNDTNRKKKDIQNALRQYIFQKEI